MSATVTRIGRAVVFEAPGGWRVKVMSYRVPGDSSQRAQYFVVRRWGVLKAATVDETAVARVMGDAYAELEEVGP